jgi:ribosomal-protein-alanine N-acetyltransferase
MAVVIESASIGHLDRLYEIEKECFKDEAFTKNQIAYLLSIYNSISLVAKENGKIVGFVIGTLDFEGDIIVGHVLTLDVCPSHRRKGVGTKLLQELEKIFLNNGAKKCRLEAREDNVAALNLYRKLGYIKVKRIDNYYKVVHGILFEKYLQG